MDGVARTEMLRQRLLFGGGRKAAARSGGDAEDEEDEEDEMQITFDAPLDGDGEGILGSEEEEEEEERKPRKDMKRRKAGRRAGGEVSRAAAATTALIGLGDDDLLGLSRGLHGGGELAGPGDERTTGAKRTKDKSKKAGRKGAQKQAVPRLPAADDRFAALYSSPDFALDPTDPRYKKEVHAQIAQEKRRKHGGAARDEPGRRERGGSAVSLSRSVLVASLKKKAKHGGR